MPVLTTLQGCRRRGPWLPWWAQAGGERADDLDEALDFLVATRGFEDDVEGVLDFGNGCGGSGAGGHHDAATSGGFDAVRFLEVRAERLGVQQRERDDFIAEIFHFRFNVCHGKDLSKICSPSPAQATRPVLTVRDRLYDP